MPFHSQTESSQRTNLKRSLYEYAYYCYGYFSFAKPNKVRQEVLMAMSEVCESLYEERKDDEWYELKNRLEEIANDFSFGVGI
jgi:hypothetical protein